MFPPKKKPAGFGAPEPMEKKPLAKKPMPTAEHEAEETPEYEEQEEYGAKLLNDMVSPLTELGLPEEDAKATLGKILMAAAKCLGATPEEEGDEPNESDTENYPA